MDKHNEIYIKTQGSLHTRYFDSTSTGTTWPTDTLCILSRFLPPLALFNVSNNKIFLSTSTGATPKNPSIKKDDEWRRETNWDNLHKELANK